MEIEAAQFELKNCSYLRVLFHLTHVEKVAVEVDSDCFFNWPAEKVFLLESSDGPSNSV